MPDDAPVVDIRLSGRGTHRCLLGHCWIWRSELADASGLPHGGAVRVLDPRGVVVGHGLASARSQIAVRLLTRGDAPITDGLLRDRMDQALTRRATDPNAAERCAPGGNPCERLIWSEGDILPGLTADRYGRALVVQATTPGMDQRLGLIVDHLRARTGATIVVERGDAPVREKEGLPLGVRMRVGEETAARAHRVTADGLTWTVDLCAAHKTGMYLDQMANQRAFARLMRPTWRVADVFCHVGGFGLRAAQRGAQVVGVDQSAEALAMARQAAADAGLAERTAWIAADAFAWLRQQPLAESAQAFDAIILDPPAFAPTRDAVPGALRGYRDLHAQALRRVRSGGLLATYTCSSHIDEAHLMPVIVQAAAQQKRTLRLIERHGQPADHPILPAVPETEYLRGWVLEVL